MPKELWTEAHDILQKAGIKIISKKKKCKKAKWLSEEGLKIVEKGRGAKGKGEKERYTHLNAQFQRRARRDKKAFLSDQNRKIEENNRMGSSRHWRREWQPTAVFLPGESQGRGSLVGCCLWDLTESDMTEAT